MIKKILNISLYLIFAWLNFVPNMTYGLAKNTEIAIYLDSITVKTSSEKHGDKIYMEITEYSNIAAAKEHRLPMFPKHWLPSDLPKLKNIVLWQGTVSSGEKKELILSLVESDFPPLDSDDPLGSIKLVLDHQHKTLKTSWDNAGFKEPIEIKKILNKKTNHVTFEMKSKQSDYIVSFYTKIKYSE